MEPTLINHVCARRPKGLAIIAFGRGNVPPAIVPALRAAIEAGVLVTVSSRCVAGRVSPRYGYDGGGLQLRKLGAILAGDLVGRESAAAADGRARIRQGHSAGKGNAGTVPQLSQR